MSKVLRQILKAIFRAMGYQMYKTSDGIVFRKKQTQGNEFSWLQEAGIKTILDIGAHKGEFSQHIHRWLPQARIIAFEPLADCFAQLKNNCSEISNFTAVNMGVGDKTGEEEINRSEFSPSSSLRPMAKLHKEAYPHTAKSWKETIQLTTLDDFGKKNPFGEKLLVKIDVQGLEDAVIRGATDTLKHATIVIVETSFQPLYEGQPLFSDVYHILKEHGFTYSGSWGQWKNPQDGTILQQDAIFIRK